MRPKGADDLQRQGKILYPAVSNWAAWQIAKALGISAREGLARFECIQPMYNLVKRQAEVEILPLARSEQLGVITYSPLGGGLLTGKYSTTQRPQEGRLVTNEMYQKRYRNQEYYVIAEKLTEKAREQGVSPAALALNLGDVSPRCDRARPRARNSHSWSPWSREIKPPECREEISLSFTPPPATDRSENQV